LALLVLPPGEDGVNVCKWGWLWERGEVCVRVMGALCVYVSGVRQGKVNHFNVLNICYRKMFLRATTQQHR
jgi:hypothetical protein